MTDDPSRDHEDHDEHEPYVIDTRAPAGRWTESTRRRDQSRARPAAADPDLRRRAHDDLDEVDESARPVSGGGATRAPRPPRSRRPRGRRHWLRWIAVLVALWLAFLVWAPIDAWNKVTRVDATPTDNRPTNAGGHNYLLVGSDSRAGLTDAQKQDLSTGSDEGARTDSIILVHVPGNGGKAVMMSIPRDSWVAIPGHRKNKINASFSINATPTQGNAKLLVDTVEQNTGVRIDDYVEIGFAGFASVVDSLGGVTIDVPFDMNDWRAGINLKKGTQTLNGANALGFVRARYSDPRGDIGRAERQRQFLSAIMSKALSPATVLLPWRYWSFTHAASSGLTIGQDASMMDMVTLLRTMKGTSSGSTLSTVVPIETESYSTYAGTAVKWDSTKAKAIFDKISNDEPIGASDLVKTG